MGGMYLLGRRIFWGSAIGDRFSNHLYLRNNIKERFLFLPFLLVATLVNLEL